jgi:two-component system sensor histidine kinase RegB
MRDRDVELAAAREAMLRNQRVIAMGTMAAGAAHELGTPLTTIGVLAKELQDQYSNHKTLVEDLAVLRRQVDACRGTITNLLATAQQTRFDAAMARPVTDFVDDVVAKWRLMRPAAHSETRIAGTPPAPNIVIDDTLGQALTNLLNNAADASPQRIEIETNWTDANAVVEVMDRGPGIPDEALQNAGSAFFSTKEPESGRGLGLFLARAAVERVGGELVLSRRDDGGSVARLVLPIAREAA